MKRLKVVNLYAQRSTSVSLALGTYLLVDDLLIRLSGVSFRHVGDTWKMAVESEMIVVGKLR